MTYLLWKTLIKNNTAANPDSDVSPWGRNRRHFPHCFLKCLITKLTYETTCPITILGWSMVEVKMQFSLVNLRFSVWICPIESFSCLIVLKACETNVSLKKFTGFVIILSITLEHWSTKKWDSTENKKIPMLLLFQWNSLCTLLILNSKQCKHF